MGFNMLIDNQFHSLSKAVQYAKKTLREQGEEVETVFWQGIESPAKFWEYLNLLFIAPIPKTKEELVIETCPNLPWAEDHFQERVGRQSLNPGKEYKNWPFYRNDENWRKDKKLFDHTYMQRIWPPLLKGIRYDYGNLDDVINLLTDDPFTRQAYLPIWYPEDTGVKFKGRTPCSLGFHFTRRNNKLHCFYPIRSCDYVRHFKNDVYMAGRLVQWVLNELKNKSKEKWEDITPGDLAMFIVSFHVFINEKSFLRPNLGDN